MGEQNDNRYILNSVMVWQGFDECIVDDASRSMVQSLLVGAIQLSQKKSLSSARLQSVLQSLRGHATVHTGRTLAWLCTM
jgi:hypothetical protein